LTITKNCFETEQNVLIKNEKVYGGIFMRKEICSMSSQYYYDYHYKYGAKKGTIIEVIVIIKCYEENGALEYTHSVYNKETNQLILDPWTKNKPEEDSMIGIKLQMALGDFAPN
jgi:hypothetical protein